ncbi:NAD(P)H-binding protein [Flavivirga sp. 57AJ16]|uniref:NmrA family NAD(P)-binding protein n=1 Tax=Flavivirga sp. 57AJ16 TaxID=3025307 RepID=UPI0023665884|nr:NAD(P)H-binding protein [Flavivirga sp. 57AJ16]MDD7886796.1 NAD(P)H-binding protein [Flavivirga sp. 57AJ16]
MKITVTGSLGHIGRSLTEILLAANNEVKVISSSSERISDIIALGAIPAIGSLEDIDFLKTHFKDADAVFTMVPPNNYFDHDLDLTGYYKHLGENYAKAISGTDIKRVVNLSTFGAHLEKGNGILKGAHYVEKTLNALPSNISLTHMRPTSFYYNLYGYIESIKAQNAIYANYGTHAIPWVAPEDIAKVVAEELSSFDNNEKIRYVVSDELNGEETAKILGKAIEKPNLKWQIVDDETVMNALKKAGMNPEIAEGLIEMYAALESGLLKEDFENNRPHTFGNKKLKDFAQEFAKEF